MAGMDVDTTTNGQHQSRAVAVADGSASSVEETSTFTLDPDTFKKIHPSEFHRRFLTHSVRPDGRVLNKFRKVRINVGSISTANGSAMVRMGETTVICGIKAEVAAPKPEAPKDGMIVPNVDMPAICSPKFKPGPPGELTQSISELINRIINGSKLLDTNTLCISPGNAVWVLYADIVFLNYEGNAVDAALAALVAALKNTDPTDDEESVLSAHVTIVVDDQWREVENFGMDGVQFLNDVSEFFRRRAELEQEYARGLQKLVRPFKDDIQRTILDKKVYAKAVISSTVVQAWSQLLNENDNLASIHLNLASNLDDVKKNIKTQATENQKKIKDKFDEIKKSNLELQRCVEKMDRLRERYMADKRGIEGAFAYQEKLMKNPKTAEKDLEAAKADADKKALVASESMEAYQEAMRETNEKKNKLFREFIPSILNELQADDENHRVNLIKNSFAKYYELSNEVLPKTQKGLEAMNTVFETISPQYDRDLLVKQIKSAEGVPADYQFEEKGAANDFAAKGRQRSPSEKADNDDEIFALPDKRKGRRMAVDRIKILDRELVDLEKKRQAVEVLLGVYNQKAAKDPRYQQELLCQKASLDIRVDNNGLKKHMLQVYIAQTDNQNPPPLPYHLVGKSIQSPTVQLNFPEVSPVVQTAPALTVTATTTATAMMSSKFDDFGDFIEMPPSSQSLIANMSISMQHPPASIPKLGSGFEQDLFGLSHDTGKSITGAEAPSNMAMPSMDSAWGAPVSLPPVSKASDSEWGAPVSSPPVAKGSRAKLSYDFVGAPRSQELSCKQGEEVEIIEQRDDGWWRVRINRDGIISDGIIPDHIDAFIGSRRVSFAAPKDTINISIPGVAPEPAEEPEKVQRPTSAMKVPSTAPSEPLTTAPQETHWLPEKKKQRDIVAMPKAKFTIDTQVAPSSQAYMNRSSRLKDPETGHNHPTYLHASGVHGHGHGHIRKQRPSSCGATRPEGEKHENNLRISKSSLINHANINRCTTPIGDFSSVPNNPSLLLRTSDSRGNSRPPSALKRPTSAPVRSASGKHNTSRPPSALAVARSKTPAPKDGSTEEKDTGEGEDTDIDERHVPQPSENNGGYITGRPLTPVALSMVKQQTVRTNVDHFRIEQVALRRLRFVVEHNQTEPEHLSIVDLVESVNMPPQMISKFFGPKYTTPHELRILVLQSIDRIRRMKKAASKGHRSRRQDSRTTVDTNNIGSQQYPQRQHNAKSSSKGMSSSMVQLAQPPEDTYSPFTSPLATSPIGPVARAATAAAMQEMMTRHVTTPGDVLDVLDQVEGRRLKLGTRGGREGDIFKRALEKQGGSNSRVGTQHQQRRYFESAATNYVATKGKNVNWDDQINAHVQQHTWKSSKKLGEEPENGYGDDDGEEEIMVPHPMLRTIWTPASSAFSEQQILKLIQRRRRRHLGL
ncbi:hypothetical protein HDV05_003230 [Chytridiales sp. JEL 0842]|nr:hypothetical protein HDV05_003230 [Chytridiales sp. JEL 0842]